MTLRTLGLAAGLALAGATAPFAVAAGEITFSLTADPLVVGNTITSTADGVTLTIASYANQSFTPTGFCAVGYMAGCYGYNPYTLSFSHAVTLVGYEVASVTTISNTPKVTFTPAQGPQWVETNFAVGSASFATALTLAAGEVLSAQPGSYAASGEGVLWSSITVTDAVTPVPVPASGVLLGGLMLAGAAIARRKRG